MSDGMINSQCVPEDGQAQDVAVDAAVGEAIAGCACLLTDPRV